MSMDKKPNTVSESSDSASSLPLFSPNIDKDTHKFTDFSSAVKDYQSCELLEVEPQEHSFHSLHLIANQSISCREGQRHESGESSSFLSKDEKKSKLEISLECVPMLQREKVSLGQEPFEVPQLTAESMVSSEDIDLDSESNPNDLPLCSTRRYKIERVFHQQSEGSDEYEDRSKAYLVKQDYAESKGSDRSESDDFPSICKLCYVLVEKSKILEAENAELIRQTQASKEEILKLQEKHKKLLEQKEEEFHVENLPPHMLKEHFMNQIQETCKTLMKVNQHLASFSFDFRGKQCDPLQCFNLQFKKLEEQVLERVEKEEKRREVEHLHAGYKKLITKLVKQYQERQSKKELDFRRFFTAVVRRPSPQEPARSFEMKSQRSRRKSKTYAQKQQNTEMDMFENNRQWEQTRQRLQWLEIALTREKQNWKQQERIYIEKNQRLQTQVNDLTHERNIYRSLAGQYSQQFSDFMSKLTKQQSDSLTQSDFFRTLSQRVFQISNCIPFEDNDEQNLFAPESEEELFEMLDRVCRFYRRIEDYNLQRDSQYQTQKSGFMRFLRELVQQNRVNPKLLLETLEGNNYVGLQYLKELIRSSKFPDADNFIPQRESIGNRILKIERTKSFTISTQGIQDVN